MFPQYVHCGVWASPAGWVVFGEAEKNAGGFSGCGDLYEALDSLGCILGASGEVRAASA